MKKVKKMMALSAFIVFFCVSLSGCTTYKMDFLENGLRIGYSNFFKKCFVGFYNWDGDLDNMNIVLPDYHREYPVVKLGGYFGTGVPTPFGINLPEEYEIEFIVDNPQNMPNLFPNGYEIKYLTFNLTIGVNIDSIEFIFDDYCVQEKQDGSYTLYRILYYIACPLDNKTFYSKDGILYKKSNDKKVNEFPYHDEAN